jgi:predicted Zn-dependent peptidase
MERQVVLEELAQSEDQPEEVVLQQLLRLACPNHPYGHPILGRREDLLAHDPTAMRQFHDRLYTAGRCVLALSGALTAGHLEGRAARGPLASLSSSRDGLEPTDLVVAAGEHRLSVPRLEAARLVMAWWQPAAADLEATMGADLATSVLAEGRRSRLVHRLREELRIVESIDLDLHPMEHGSLALLEAVCDPQDLPAVRSAIEAVWSELIEEPLDEAEWQRARRLVINGYRFGLESAGGVACQIGNAQLWRRLRDLQEPLRMVERWTAAAVRDRAMPLLDPARACVLEAVPA